MTSSVRKVSTTLSLICKFRNLMVGSNILFGQGSVPSLRSQLMVEERIRSNEWFLLVAIINGIRLQKVCTSHVFNCDSHCSDCDQLDMWAYIKRKDIFHSGQTLINR